jgi:hypothetical protein
MAAQQVARRIACGRAHESRQRGRITQRRQRSKHRTKHLLGHVVRMPRPDVRERDRVHGTRERCVQGRARLAVAALRLWHQVRPRTQTVGPDHAFVSPPCRLVDHGDGTET